MIKKLLSFAMVAMLLVSLSAVALAADEEVLSANDATLAPRPEGGDPFITNSGEDDATIVSTEQDGFYAEWSNVPASTHIRMSYDAGHDDGEGGELSLYVNGSFAIKIPFADTGSWWDAFPESEKVAVNIPEGATIRIQLDEGDKNANIRNIILTKGVAEAGDEDDDGDDETPKTGDPGMVMYIAMAGAASSALLLRKKIKKS